jgi:hypothetical protein
MNKKINHSWKKESHILSKCVVCGIWRTKKREALTNRWFVSYENLSGKTFLLYPSCIEKYKQLSLEI